jgi:hypothetical protein
MITGAALWAVGAIAFVKSGLTGGWLGETYYWVALVGGSAALVCIGVAQVRQHWHMEMLAHKNPLEFYSGQRLFSREQYVDEFKKHLGEVSDSGARSAFRSKVLVLTGRSGAGKSYLLSAPTGAVAGGRVGREKIDVRSAVESLDWRWCGAVDGFRDLDDFKTQLKKTIGQSECLTFNEDLDEVISATHRPGAHVCKHIVVFDHFEQFVAGAQVTSEIRNWFIDKVLKPIVEKGTGVCVVLVVRQDYYRELRNFRSVISLEQDTIEVAGIGPQNDVKASIRDTVTDETLYAEVVKDLSLNDGTGLPLEIRLVDLMLEELLDERGRRALTLRDYQREDGKVGLIDRYFLTRTEGRIADLVRSVLYVFCASPTYRRVFSVDDVSSVTHRGLESVRSAVRRLVVAKLLKRVGERYEIAHDYFARHFHALSGVLLEPINRDNITHFVDVLGSERAARLRATEARSISVHGLIYYVLLSLLFVRFAGPSYGFRWQAVEENWGFGAYLASVTMSAPYVDLLYLPSLIASSLSSWYAYRIHRSLLLIVPRAGSLGAVGSYASIGVCYAMVLGGVLVPRWWAFCAGVGGLSVGIRLSLLSWKLARRGGRRRAVTLNYLRDIGLYTILNSSMLMAAGFAYGLAIREWAHSPETLQWLLLIELWVSVMFGAFMLYVTHEETTPGKAAALLGLADR